MAAPFLFSVGAGAEVGRLNSQQSGQGRGWGIWQPELTCQGRGEEEICSVSVCTHRHKHMYAKTKYLLGMGFESGQGCDPAALRQLWGAASLWDTPVPQPCHWQQPAEEPSLPCVTS